MVLPPWLRKWLRRAWGRERFQPTNQVIGGDEFDKVLTELVLVLVLEPFHGGILDSAGHAFDLAVRPQVARLRMLMLNMEFGTTELKDLAEEWLLAGQHLFDVL